MAKILKNITEEDIFIDDTGVNIEAEDQYSVTSGEDYLWADSNDVISYIGDGDIVVNDGTSDLTANDGLKLLQDIYPTKMKIIGSDEQYAVDVILHEGQKKFPFQADVSVDQVLSFDDFADTWFTVTNAGSIGDTVTVNIQGMTSVVSTLTATEAGDEIALADLIVSDLNNDDEFPDDFKASRVEDNAIVHISSRHIGEYGERTSFSTDTTGTTTITDAWDEIVRRSKQNFLARDARDKRYGNIGISGTVESIPGAVGGLFIQHAENSGSSVLLVDGSSTPVVFSVDALSEKDVYVTELRFYGNANGIKFGQFLAKNSALTNGIEVKIKSGNQITTLPLITTTDDFKHLFSFGDTGFQLHVQAGRDDFLASFRFATPFPLRYSGLYSTDDYIKVTIQDDLTAGTLDLRFLAYGFEREI